MTTITLPHIKKFDRLKGLLNTSNTSISFTKFEISDDVKDLMNSMFKNLKPVMLEKYPKSTFYFNSKDKVIFQITSNNNLYVKWENLFEVLKTKYKLEFQVIMDLCEHWVKNTYKLKIKETSIGLSSSPNQIEDLYKFQSRISDNVNDFMDNKFKNLDMVILPPYPDITFYFSSKGEFIFGITRSNILYLQDYNLIEILEEKYLLGFDKIENICKKYLNNAYELNIQVIRRAKNYFCSEVEYAYKLKFNKLYSSLHING